jgi:UMF1 family MFS transporter
MILKGDPKTMRAWTYYDWANSVYSLVITTAIFPLYYEAVMPEKVHFLGREFVNTALINYAGSFGFLLVCLMVPILSGIADYTDSKRKFLAFFCTLGAISCAGLYFFDPSSPALGLVFYVVALIGFWGGLVFYNAYLPQIAPPEMHDKLSARGFAMGYIGSSILLITCLIMYFQNNDLLKFSFVLTGLWWFGFAQIALRKLPGARSENKYKKSMLTKGYKELRSVWHQMKATKRLRRYLQSFFVYSMGVQTVMLVAVYFGTKEIAWSSDTEKTTGLIVSVLIIQFIAIPGAYLMAWLSGKWGNIKTLILANVLWALICIAALALHEPIEFYILAGFVGFVMGGIQSLSRSTYAKFIPETQDTASFFSFYEVGEKLGIVLGLFFFALLEELGDMRTSILALIVFFIGGILLLSRVPKEETTAAIRTSSP